MTEELKPLLEEFLEEMLFLYGSDGDKRSLSEPGAIQKLFEIWERSIRKHGAMSEKNFRKRWDILISTYKAKHMPMPAHFLSVEIPKEVEAYEPEKPKTAEELAKIEAARERALQKMRNLNKQ